MVRVFLTDEDDIDGIFDDVYADVIARTFENEEAAKPFINICRKLGFSVVVWYMKENEDGEES